MIRYALACADGHEFEAWFRDSADFDEQAQRSLVECPSCGAKDVKKQIMAPAVSTSRKREAREAQAEQQRTMAMASAAVRRHIKENFDDVGSRFPSEARAIHDGLAPDRAIYGQASAEEAEALREDGVEVCPLPPMLNPDFDKKVN